jgi:RND family efflux transporter MFP subunit
MKKQLFLHTNLSKKVFLFAMLLLICGCTKPKSTNAENPVLTVSVSTPKLQDITNVVHANGSIKAWRETVISAEVGGLDISEVNVDVGDKVKKGQVLAKLNAAELNADLLNQLANLSEAKANLEQAQTEARQSTLLEKAGAVSTQDLLSYKTKAKTAQAKLEAAQAQLKLQQIKLSYTEIKAPDDGVISSRTATTGSIIQNGSELFRMIKAGRLEWQAEINSSDMSKIKVGQHASITDNTGNIINGSVSRIAPDLNQSTLNGLIYVDIPPNPELRLGMYLSGEINVGATSSMTIPSSAVINRDGYNYIMRLNKNNRVNKIKIQLSDYMNNAAIVESGIKLSDRIVTLGSGFLNDGDLVRVVQDKSK